MAHTKAPAPYSPTADRRHSRRLSPFWRHFLQMLAAMAVGMTLPMVAWMAYRRMGARNCYEMAAAMVLPVVPFLCLVWFGVTESAQCGGYCVAMIVAMLALMRYRRTEYSTEHHRAGGSASLAGR